MFLQTALLILPLLLARPSPNTPPPPTPIPTYQHQYKRPALALLVLLPLLALGATTYRLPRAAPAPYRPEARIVRAGIWAVHFGVDNEGHDSQKGMLGLISDMELDVVGLLETDLHVRCAFPLCRSFSGALTSLLSWVARAVRTPRSVRGSFFLASAGLGRTLTGVCRTRRIVEEGNYVRPPTHLISTSANTTIFHPHHSTSTSALGRTSTRGAASCSARCIFLSPLSCRLDSRHMHLRAYAK